VLRSCVNALQKNRRYPKLRRSDPVDQALEYPRQDRWVVHTADPPRGRTLSNRPHRQVAAWWPSLFGGASSVRFPGCHVGAAAVAGLEYAHRPDCSQTLVTVTLPRGDTEDSGPAVGEAKTVTFPRAGPARRALLLLRWVVVPLPIEAHRGLFQGSQVSMR
jgi:hypothetical protein